MELILTMRNEEIDKLRVIREALDKKLSWQEAGERLSLSVREIGYLCARVREEGNKGIIHRNPCRPQQRQRIFAVHKFGIKHPAAGVIDINH